MKQIYLQYLSDMTYLIFCSFLRTKQIWLFRILEYVLQTKKNKQTKNAH